MPQKKEKKKIFGKHFTGMILIFVIVIVTVLTFVSFIEDAMDKDGNLSKNKKVQK